MRTPAGGREEGSAEVARADWTRGLAGIAIVCLTCEQSSAGRSMQSAVPSPLLKSNHSHANSKRLSRDATCRTQEWMGRRGRA